MKTQDVTPLKRKRMDFYNLKSTRRFREFIGNLLVELEDRCFYCRELLYFEDEYEYGYPEEMYEKGGDLYGAPKSFIDRTWNYHVDHKIPLALGGTNDLDNLTIACPPCNLSKGIKPWRGDGYKKAKAVREALVCKLSL